jgi:putative nucleotidyltransferase-like protein
LSAPAAVLPPPAPTDEGLWAAVDALVARAPSLADVYSHRLELFAARQLRAVGDHIPEDLLARERRAAIAALTAPLLLSRIREAYDGPLLLIKGPEVAARYPDPTLRLFGDVDLLTPDADAAQAALLAAGFVEIGDPLLYIDIHHLRPLELPGLPLVVEVHSRPKWVAGLPAPTLEELLVDAVPTAVGAPGILAPSPAKHALLLAAHSWAHEPLRLLRDVVDFAAVADEADREDLRTLAAEWGISRLWRSTDAAARAVLHGDAQPRSLRLWAQNLGLARERTVLENHLQRWLSDFWVLSPTRALRRWPTIFRDEVLPDRGEPWRRKLSRSALAVRNAHRRRSEHDDEAGVS